MPPTGSDEGIQAAVALRESHPEIGVVVLSQYAEPAYALALLDEGSERRAYLLKERVSDSAQLVDAIGQVAAGGSVVDPKVVEVLVEAKSRERTSPPGAPHRTRVGGAGRDRPGQEQLGGRRVSRALGQGRSRSTSTRCSRSWGSPRRPTPAGGSRAVLLYLAAQDDS